MTDFDEFRKKYVWHLYQIRTPFFAFTKIKILNSPVCNLLQKGSGLDAAVLDKNACKFMEHCVYFGTNPTQTSFDAQTNRFSQFASKNTLHE